MKTTDVLIELIKIQNLDRRCKDHAFKELRYITSPDWDSYKDTYHSTSLIKEARS